MSHGPAAMSCGVQLGYSYIPPPGAIPTSQIILSCTGITQPPTSCCENGRPIVTDPCTGQSTCTCQLNPILTAYPKVPSLADQIYNATSLTTQNLLGVEPSAFYSPIKANYDMDRIPEAWKGLPSANPCYPYDPNLAATHPYSGLYSGLDLNSASRRKNATRETTSALKAWLYEHRKNPYPTKGEKIMLAIITKMTLTQVSTWFANARRRLKKENKMTWPSKEKEEVLGGETKDRSSGSQDNDSSDEGKDGLSAIDDDDERLDVSGFDAKDDFLDPVEDEIHPDLSEISDMENEPGLGADKHESSASADSGDDRAGSLSATSAGGVRHPPGRGEVGNGRRLDDARPVRKQREEQPPQPAVIPKPKIWSISNIVGTDGSSSSSSSSSSKQASGMHGRGGLGETVPARPSILHYDSAVNRERLRRLQAPSYLSYHELYPGAVLHPPPQHKDALRSICSSGHSLETPPHTPPERLAAAHFDLTQDGTFVQGPLVADHKEMMPLAKGTTTATLLQQ